MIFPTVAGIEFDTQTVSLILATFFFGGLIKGAIGFGLPIVVISILSMFLPVSFGIALNVIPPIILNMWQATHKCSVTQNFKRIWLILAGVALGIGISTTLITGLSPNLLLGIVGVVILIFCINSRWGFSVSIPSNREKPVGLVTGILCGIMGGLTSVSVPPFIVFLVALKLKKDEFVSTLGLYFITVSSFLVIAFSAVGLLTPAFVPLALICTAVTAVGMWMGIQIRNRLNQDKFYNAVLIVLALISLNLIRRAIF